MLFDAVRRNRTFATCISTTHFYDKNFYHNFYYIITLNYKRSSHISYFY